MKKIFFVFCFIIFGIHFKGFSQKESKLAPQGANKTQWEILFDGGDPALKWRSVKGNHFPRRGWEIEGNQLVLMPGRKGGDIITRETFADFELIFEYKLSDSANTGIKYLVTKMKNSKGRSVWIGPEFQLIDDYKHDAVIDNKSPETSTGAMYLLYAPVNKHLNPSGEWNSGRVVVKGNRVEHWLNGKKIVEYKRGSADFRKRVSETKFKEFNDYGEAVEGHILLQDHKDQASFRNIKIRKL